MEYKEPDIYAVEIQAQDVKNMGPDSASGCNSSCCFTREGESW